MKKLASIAIVAVFATLALTSCKKDYTCTCSVHDFVNDTTYSQSTPINDAKKNDATDACNALESSSIAGVIELTCDID